jgi:hypothetical protein
MGTVLTPSVRMVDAPGLPPPVAEGLFQGSLDQFLSHPSAHSVAENLHRSEVFDACQIQSVFAGRGVGDIGPIDLRRPSDFELLIEQIRSYWQIMSRVGRGLELLTLNTPEA